MDENHEGSLFLYDVKIMDCSATVENSDMKVSFRLLNDVKTKLTNCRTMGAARLLSAPNVCSALTSKHY